MSAIPRSFTILASGTSVAGPSSGGSTDNALARWDGTGGRTLQNSVWTLDDTGTLTGAGSQTLAMLSTGAIALAASGTNQNITLTPSGTGTVIASNNAAIPLRGSRSDATTPIAAGGQVAVSAYNPDQTNNNTTGYGFNSVDGLGNFFNAAQIISVVSNHTNGATAGNLVFFTRTGGSLAEKARIEPNGNALFGTTTDSSNGRIQLATHTTSAGGIGFGTELSIWRASSTQIRLGQSGGGTTQLSIINNGGETATLGVSGTNFTIGTNGGVTALTIDSSQNATFAAGVRPTSTSSQLLGTSSLGWGEIHQSAATTATSTLGMMMRTDSAATSGQTVRVSPYLRLRGTAWDTSASQTVDFFIENLPTSAATPTGTLKFGYSLNGAAATYPMTLTSAGQLTTLGLLQVANASKIASPSDGVLRLTDSGTSDFNRLQFGGTTSSYPALKRSSAGLLCVLADDSSYASFNAKEFTANAAAVAGGAGTISYGGTTQTTVGAAGGASALPATPTGYIIVNVAGTNRVVPFYAAS